MSYTNGKRERYGPDLGLTTDIEYLILLTSDKGPRRYLLDEVMFDTAGIPIVLRARPVHDDDELGVDRWIPWTAIAWYRVAEDDE